LAKIFPRIYHTDSSVRLATFQLMASLLFDEEFLYPKDCMGNTGSGGIGSTGGHLGGIRSTPKTAGMEASADGGEWSARGETLRGLMVSNKYRGLEY
jgi:hypothetical protein